MKVVLINGSPRKNGNTAYTLNECKMEIIKEGLEVETINLAGKEIKSCIACYKCKGTGSCVLKDEANDFMDIIRGADGLIIGAPVYFGTPRGDLMNLIQRIGMVSRGNDKFLSWMPGGPVAVARRGGLSSSYQEMLMFYFINEMIVPGSDYWNIVFAGKEEGSAREDVEGIENMKKFATNVAKLIKKLK